MHKYSLSIEEAKQRLLLPELSRRLRIGEDLPERDGKAFRCPRPEQHANGDRNPSCNFYAGLTRIKCHTCGLDGDGPDLISLMLNVDRKEGIRQFLEMAGGTPCAPQKPPAARKERRALTMPRDLTSGTEIEWRALGRLRRIEPGAVSLAAGNRVLFFGTVKGFFCWIVTDEKRLIAEARRMDGKPFPATDKLGERKAHTLFGSVKNWPVGIQLKHSNPDAFGRIMFCEGGPDLLAGYHFCEYHGNGDALPVAMLGRNASKMHPDSFRLFRNKRVRIFPHTDPDGGGLKAAEKWAEQIQAAGAIGVDWFDFRPYGNARDLNDCTSLKVAEQSELLKTLLP